MTLIDTNGRTLFFERLGKAFGNLVNGFLIFAVAYIILYVAGFTLWMFLSTAPDHNVVCVLACKEYSHDEEILPGVWLESYLLSDGGYDTALRDESRKTLLQVDSYWGTIASEGKTVWVWQNENGTARAIVLPTSYATPFGLAVLVEFMLAMMVLLLIRVPRLRHESWVREGLQQYNAECERVRRINDERIGLGKYDDLIPAPDYKDYQRN